MVQNWPWHAPLRILHTQSGITIATNRTAPSLRTVLFWSSAHTPETLATLILAYPHDTV